MHASPLTDLAVLHGLRLKGFLGAPKVAAFVGHPVDQVTDRLEAAADQGYALHRTGARTGWTLTTEGRKEGERLLAVELDQAGHRGAVTALYHRFRALNPELLQACADWQVCDGERGVLNDHRDPAYDAAVVDRLGNIDSLVQPICAELGALFDRFDHYGPRFTTALARLAAGDLDWFDRPLIDSYHTVWFELHEDLLATLGLDRTSEHTERTTSPDRVPAPSNPEKSE